MPSMVLGTKTTKMNKTWSLPIKIQSPVPIKKGKTRRKETNYGDTKKR